MNQDRYSEKAFDTYRDTEEADAFEIIPEGHILCIPEALQKPKILLAGNQDGFARPRVKVVKTHSSVTGFEKDDILLVNPRFVNQVADFTLDDNLYLLVPKQWILGKLNEYRLVKRFPKFLKSNKAGHN